MAPLARMRHGRACIRHAGAHLAGVYDLPLGRGGCCGRGVGRGWPLPRGGGPAGGSDLLWVMPSTRRCCSALARAAAGFSVPGRPQTGLAGGALAFFWGVTAFFRIDLGVDAAASVGVLLLLSRLLPAGVEAGWGQRLRGLPGDLLAAFGPAVLLVAIFYGALGSIAGYDLMVQNLLVFPATTFRAVRQLPYPTIPTGLVDLGGRRQCGQPARLDVKRLPAVLSPVTRVWRDCGAAGVAWRACGAWECVVFARPTAWQRRYSSWGWAYLCKRLAATTRSTCCRHRWPPWC